MKYKCKAKNTISDSSNLSFRKDTSIKYKCKAKNTISDMATQNVCRYFKFGHCKFCDKCRFLHVKERCENPTCEIRSCSLRHPRKCKWQRDYGRCKYGEWCSFDHNNISDNQKSINKILQRLEHMSKIILEKDNMINHLAEKIRKLEEHFDSNDEVDITEHENNETELNLTFQNPYLANRFPCEICDFEAKSNSGLQLHVKAKHKSNEIITEESSPNSPEFETVNETNLDIQFNCDQCEFSFETVEQLQLHVTEKHGAGENNETCEIKLLLSC